VPWADTDSIGWIRYSLDQRKVPYIYLRDEDIRAGNLRDRVDVLLYGHVDLELAEQIQGLPKAWGPMAYKKTPQTPSLGTPAESDDITGGIGWEGMAQLQRFIESGGLMVTLGSGSMLPLDGGMVRGVRRGGRGRAPQHARWRCRFGCRFGKRCHAHSRRPRARYFRPPGFPAGLRLPRPHLGLSPEFSFVRYPAPLAAHGLLHYLPRRPGRP